MKATIGDNRRNPEWRKNFSSRRLITLGAGERGKVNLEGESYKVFCPEQFGKTVFVRSGFL